MNGCVGKAKIGEARGDLEPEEPAPRPRILVIAGDQAIRRTFSRYLEEQGLDVAVAAGPGPMSKLLKAASYSLLVLDLRRGEEDDLLREVRARSDIPIVATSGHQGGETDRVAGLELGADDYLTGPLSLRELLPASTPCCGASKGPSARVYIA